MSHFFSRFFLFLIILFSLIHSIELEAQLNCPTSSELLDKGYSDNNINHDTEYNNGDEFGVFHVDPFMIKIDDYPPLASFPMERSIMGECPGIWYYMSFDTEPVNRPGPIPYFVMNHVDWDEKPHDVWTFLPNGEGYYLQILPPKSGVDGGADFLMNFNGTEHEIFAGGIWSNFVTTPTVYYTDFHVTIEGPEIMEEGSSAEFIANIFGGNGDYGIKWEYRVPPSLDWVEIKDNNHALDWFDIEYPVGITKSYYFYQTDIESEYKQNISMGSQSIEVRVTIEDHAGGSFSTSATKIIKKGLEVSFANKIESTENYGKLILDEDKANPINSGEARLLAFDIEAQRIIRTNELPFIVDFIGTGKSEKTTNWIFESPVYDLNYSFAVTPTTPAEMKNQFTKTDPATIRNLLEGVAISGGQVQFKDPWFYYKDNNENWFQSDILKPYNSPFNIFNTTINTYGGVFLDQPYTGNNPVYYSVKVDEEQTISINGVNHKFYFLNWEGTDVSFETPYDNETAIVFNNSSASANARIKGTQLSNFTNAYSQNGQRKFIRSSDGYLHCFYESMNGVWYERSTDTGQSWELLHSEYPPLDNVVFKNPSMSFYTTSLDVVHEVLAYAVDYLDPLEPDKNDVVCIRNFVDGVTSQYAAEISTTDPLNSTYNYYNPVVACAHNGNTLVVWQTIKDGVGKKLQYAYGHWNSNGVWQLYDTGNISNSATGSYNPALCVSLSSNPITFHLAWNEGDEIYYTTLSPDALNQLEIATKQWVSQGSGYGFNFNPSIIELSGFARISWIGSRYIDQQVIGTVEYKTILKNLGNDTYRRFGHHIKSVSLSRDADNPVYVLGWSEFDSRSNKFVTNNDFTQIYNFGVTGDYLKIGTGDDLDNMYGMIYDTESLPYSFTKSSSLNDIMNPMNKITSLSINTGREGVVYIDTAQFYFAIGDITADNQPIDFIEIPDSVTIDSKETLNQYFTSNSFQVTDNSSFYYTVQYGTTDSLTAYSLLGENDYINFKVELIDDITGEIIGQFDDAIFNKTNLELYDNISYRVNTQGIGNRTVRLRLVTDNNFNPEYSISQMLSDEYVLGKQVINEINYKGSLEVDSYDLSQNYPNPFNPSTTIKYQIPEPGLVTIKIYDILGREVTTLVDEFKNEGRYEVTFNASNFTSGVYIYSIRSNDFSASKKLMLLK